MWRQRQVGRCAVAEWLGKGERRGEERGTPALDARSEQRDSSDCGERLDGGRERGPSEEGTAGEIPKKSKGSFAKLVLFARSRPSIRVIRRMWAARVVAVHGTRFRI